MALAVKPNKRTIEQTDMEKTSERLNDPIVIDDDNNGGDDKNAFVDLLVNAFMDWFVNKSNSCKCSDVVEFNLPLSKLSDLPNVMEGYKAVMGSVIGLSYIDKQDVNAIMARYRETDEDSESEDLDEASESEDLDEAWAYRCRRRSCMFKCPVETFLRLVGKEDYARLLTDIILRFCLVDLEDGQIDLVVSALGNCIRRAVEIVEKLPESVLEALDMDDSCKDKMIENLYCILHQATTNYYEDKANRESSRYVDSGRYYKRELYEYVTSTNCWRNSVVVLGQMLDGKTGECWEYFTCHLHGDAPNPREQQPFENKTHGLKTQLVRDWTGNPYHTSCCSGLPSGHYHTNVDYLSDLVECLQDGDLSKILSATLVVGIQYACEEVLTNCMSERYNLYDDEYQQMNEMVIEACSASLNQDELVYVFDWKEEVVFECEN